MLEKIYAVARISGNISNPNLKAIVYFYPYKDGSMVEVEAFNLPNIKNYLIFPIHIHDGKDCEIDIVGNFKNILGHYNPSNVMHPYHSGDMPPLFSNNGYAYMRFYTTRFKVYEVVDKLVVIHEQTDNSECPSDFGMRIGCGKIEKFNTN